MGSIERQATLAATVLLPRGIKKLYLMPPVLFPDQFFMTTESCLNQPKISRMNRLPKSIISTAWILVSLQAQIFAQSPLIIESPFLIDESVEQLESRVGDDFFAPNQSDVFFAKRASNELEVSHPANLESPLPISAISYRRAIVQDAPAPAQEIVTDSEFAQRFEELKRKHGELSKKIDAATDLKSDDKKELQQQLTNSNAELTKAKESLAEIGRLLAEVNGMDQELKSIQSNLDQPSLPPIAIPNGQTLAQLQQSLEQAKQTLNTRRIDLDNQNAALKGLAGDLQKLTGEIEANEKQIAKSKKELAAIQPADSLKAEHELLVAEAGLLQIELVGEQLRIKNLRHPKLEPLLTLKRDLAQRRWIEQQRLVQVTQKQVDQYRVEEIERLARSARIQADYAHPAVKSLATENAELLDRRAKLNLSIVDYSSRLAEINEELSLLSDDFENIKTKLEVAGLTKAIGLMLRRKRDELPRAHEQRDLLAEIEQQIPLIQIGIIDLESNRNHLADIQSLVQTRVESTSSQYPDLNSFQLEWYIRDEYERQREIIDATIKDQNELARILGDIDSKSRQLKNKTQEFSNFVDKHVLWIRSTDQLSLQDLKEIVPAFKNLFVFEQWQLLFDGLADRWRSRPWESLAFIFVFIAVFLLRSRLKSVLRRANQRFLTSRSLLFRPTLEAGVYTLILSSLWPMALVFIGWQLSFEPDRSSLAGALSASFLWIGLQYLIASLLYHVTRSDGMAIHHFAWPKVLVAALRHAIGWVIVICLPMSFLRMFFDHYESGVWADSVGRLLFITIMIAWAIILWRLVTSISRYLKENIQSRRQKWLLNWRWLFIVLMIVIPIGLAGIAAVGYYFSAAQIGGRLQLSAWVVLLAVIVHSLFSRLLTIARQKISMRQMSFGGLLTPRSDEAPPDTDGVDIDAVQGQVGRLVTGLSLMGVAIILWQVWAGVLPAVQILDQVTLWESSTETSREITAADGSTSSEASTTTVPTTLTHLLLAITILVITWITSRNLPGLLEITLLDRLPIDRGGRYAIAVVIRYVLAGAGIVIAAHAIGIKWNSVQWLIAAMTVGLGFGLQEIFGNFVSGIIILLERPVRVGDLVTVSGTTGYITKIQLRATTIIDFDKRELIVPNKKFITDDVINHTLTDTVSRMIIPVGIAYGSDTQLAHDLLIKVAKENPHVMNEPEPYVIFKSFGASCLDFDLRVYLAERDHIIDVQHELHMTIDQEFRAANIEIAFPQQDIHIRSVSVESEAA